MFISDEKGAARIDWAIMLPAFGVFFALGASAVSVGTDHSGEGLAADITKGSVQTTQFTMDVPKPLRVVSAASSGGTMSCNSHVPVGVTSQCHTKPVVTSEVWSMSDGSLWERVVSTNNGEDVLTTVFEGGRMVTLGAGRSDHIQWFDARGDKTVSPM